MFIEERTCNGDSMDCSLVALCADGAALNGYAFGFGGDNTDGNLGVSSAEELRTYKRRKQSRLSSESSLQEDGRGSEGAAGQLPGQTIKKPGDMVAHKNSLEQDGLSRIVCPVLLDGIDDCPHGHWRRVVLEEISQSLGVSEGGIHRCIREAIMHSQFRYGNMPKVQNATEQTAWNQESAKRHGDSQKLHSQLNSTTKIPDRKQNFAKGHVDASPVGSQNETSDRIHVHHNTELCQQVFHKVIISEKFALLCKLLCENFQGVKVDSFFDFSIINSRMKEGAYEQSPVLFCADIQQVWGKFQRIGAEMVSLAKSLSDLSRTSYREKVGGLVNGAYEEGKFEDSDHTKSEQTEACAMDKDYKCMRCRSKTEGKDFLVCDSCEQVYHIRCIEPAVEEIPPTSWFCANCTASGVESLHDNCVVCERINDTRIQTNGGGDEMVPTGEELLSDLEERSDCSMDAKNGLHLSSKNIKKMSCKFCGSGGEDGQKFRACGHPLCPFKYYHVRCLSSQQLKSHGSCWYCPSCLCRACLTDKDDDDIVLCDGCDEAYHIYCMEPPRTSIPRGKWFCSQCDGGIEAIRKAKMAYEDHEKQQKRKKKQSAIEAVGSVDMLLNAAEKLKCEEKMAATVRKR